MLSDLYTPDCGYSSFFRSQDCRELEVEKWTYWMTGPTFMAIKHVYLLIQYDGILTLMMLLKTRSKKEYFHFRLYALNRTGETGMGKFGAK